MNTEKISKVFLLLILVGLVYVFYNGYKNREEIENYPAKLFVNLHFVKAEEKHKLLM